MTLNTKIYIHGAVDVPEFFEFCQRALLAFDDEARSLDQVVWSDEEGYSDKSTRWRANRLGQGLPAILDMTYRTEGPLQTAEAAAEHEGPLQTAEAAAEHEGWCNEDGDCDGKYHTPACWAKVSLDTTYGYRDVRNWGCGDLHAALIKLFGGYLDARGVTFSWRNEYTGDVHSGYDGLEELGLQGANASAWFEQVAKPAIEADAAKNGATVEWHI